MALLLLAGTPAAVSFCGPDLKAGRPVVHLDRFRGVLQVEGYTGFDGGAEFASLLEMAKLNGIEPYAYLEDVLERIIHGHAMSQIGDFLPWNFTASRGGA